MLSSCFFFFFFNDTATTEIYTLSLHDALPICLRMRLTGTWACSPSRHRCAFQHRETQHLHPASDSGRSEEHTSELQSHLNLVCRLLLEKKKKNNKIKITID